ncbi:MAG: aquaporin family protein [Thermoplasmata archaeon]|nr:aquaporin family protein [Thermoplasmata archaeon]
MTVSVALRTASEGVGTALLVGIGIGSIVGGDRLGGVPQWVIALAWFFAVLVPIYLFIRVSGAHLNPVVTLALAASGRIAWREAPPYVLGQVGGAFLGAGFVLGVFGDVAHLGATVPTGGNVALAFPAELAFTAALVAAVFALADGGEGRGRWRLLLPPTVVAVSTFLIGPWTGSSLNPARTLAPAVLSGTYTDLWVYLTAVPLGALLIAGVWRPKAVDRLDRGPGRRDSSS